MTTLDAVELISPMTKTELDFTYIATARSALCYKQCFPWHHEEEHPFMGTAKEHKPLKFALCLYNYHGCLSLSAYMQDYM